MKTLKEYITESFNSKKYLFKVKIAGDITEDGEKKIQSLLEKYGVENFAKNSTTPIQGLPLDFPKLRNVNVHIYDLTLAYPATPFELHEYICAGYGMPAVFTPAGVGTEVAEGKEVRNFNGKDYLMEMAFDADFAIVKAWKGDTMGNLVFRATARNFNPMMAMAGKITIAEVEELVEPGELDPNMIHTPGIYVHRIFQGKSYEKRIEQRTVRA